MNTLDYILIILTIIMFIASLTAIVRADQRSRACDYWHRLADQRAHALEDYERRHARTRCQ